MTLRSRNASERRAWGIEALETRDLMATGVSIAADGLGALGDKVGKATVRLVAGDDAGGAISPVTVTLNTGGGTAVPGVDYTPVTKTVTLDAANPTAAVEVPILTADPSLGSRTLKLNLSPTPALPDGATSYVVIQHGADKTPPEILRASAERSGGLIVGFSLTFSDDMAIGPAQDVRNYAVIDPTSVRVSRDRQFAGATRTIPLKSAVYDPATRTVLLVPAAKVKTSISFVITDQQTAEVLHLIGQAAASNTDPSPHSKLVAPPSTLTDKAGNPMGAKLYSGDNYAFTGTFTTTAARRPAPKEVLRMIRALTDTSVKPVKRRG